MGPAADKGSGNGNRRLRKDLRSLCPARPPLKDVSADESLGSGVDSLLVLCPLERLALLLMPLSVSGRREGEAAADLPPPRRSVSL